MLFECHPSSTDDEKYYFRFTAINKPSIFENYMKVMLV